MRELGGLALIVLGCWAAYTTSRTLTSRGGWAEHRWLAIIGLVFVGSCFLPGAALLGDRFRPWMLIPLGVGYWVLIPFPCYFKWANHGRINKFRRILFFLVGAGLVAAGAGLVPLGWLAG